MSERVGCSDGNCILRSREEQPHQHTNAGCRCLRDVPTPLRLAIKRRIAKQQAEIERLRAAIYEHGELPMEQRVRIDPVQYLRTRYAPVTVHHRSCDLLNAEIERLRAELAHLKAFTYCAYCGAEFPVDGDASDVSEHIAVCEVHPMNKAQAEIERLRAGRDEALGTAADYEREYAEKGGYLLARLKRAEDKCTEREEAARWMYVTLGAADPVEMRLEALSRWPWLEVDE